MSGKHMHKPFEGHMHDFEAHIRAVEEDLEYYRVKRFEPRIFYLTRRGIISFYDLLKARVVLKRKNQFFKPRKPQGKNIEARVRYLGRATRWSLGSKKTQKNEGPRRRRRESGRIDRMQSTDSKYKVGDAVLVAAENPSGNPRTPHYIRGKRGVIGAVHGLLENVRDHRGIHKPLYTVRFDLPEVSSCGDRDSVWVDVHEEWLSALDAEERN